MTHGDHASRWTRRGQSSEHPGTVDDPPTQWRRLPVTPAEVRRCSRPLVVDGLCAARVPEITAQLRALILDRALEGRPSAPTLSRGGWRSGDVLRWQSPAIQVLRDQILGCVTARADQVSSWAMVSRAGDHHPRHVHQGAVASAVYYVDSGGGGTPTLLEVDGHEIEVAPVPDRIVLFAASMWHRVPPVETTDAGYRVTIAVDFLA